MLPFSDQIPYNDTIKTYALSGGCIMKRLSLLCLSVVLAFSLTACQEKKGDEGFRKYVNIYQDILETERAESGLTWPQGQALPSTAPVAEELDGIRIIGKSNDVKSMLTSFQGIVNRTKPRVYLYNASDAEEKWADEMGMKYTLTKEEDTIIEKYKNEIKGLVIWDKKQKDTLNLATTYAGIYDALVVTPKQAEKYQAEPFHFPVLEDYTGKFNDKYEVYEYLYNNLWEHCNKRLVMGLSPESHGSYSRDLAVAAKAAVLWIQLVEQTTGTDGKPVDGAEVPRDMELLGKFFKDCTPGETYYAGWWASEGKGIEVSSGYGIPTVPADYYENYTVYAGASRELDIPVVPAKPKLEGKAYIAFTISDGDNMQYCQHFMKTHRNMWSNTKRGDIPISWTFSPPLYDAGPQLLNYYYKTASANDFLIAGPSGVGYTNPILWESTSGSNENLLKYIKLSESYFRRTAFNFTTVWHQVNDVQAELVSRNWNSLLGYSTQSTMSGQSAYAPVGNGIVKIQTHPSYDGDIPRVERIIREQLVGNSFRNPVFMMPQIIAWEAGVTEINQIAASLKKDFGDKVEFVRVDHLCMLYAEYMDSIYNASLQAKATASGEDGDAAASKAVDGSFAKNQGWQSSNTGEKWLQVDLGENYILSRYMIHNAATGYYSKAWNTRGFILQGSTDGTNWTDIHEVKDNTSNIVDTFVDEFTARYVRLLITDPGEDGVARIQEFEVWGIKENRPDWQRSTY